MEKIILRRSQLRKDDFFKHGFTEGYRSCSAIITRENTAVAGAKWMENEKKQELEANVVAKNTRKDGNRRKKREASQERWGTEEDDVTKDASEQFAKEK